MSNPEHVGLTLNESMSGFVGMGHDDPVEGHAAGKTAGTEMTFRVTISIASVYRFIHQPEHAAGLTGSVHFGPTGEELAIQRGQFNVFTIDPETGHRQMSYEFVFSLASGENYYFYGQKKICDDPGFDVLSDLTTLFVTLHSGEDADGPIVGAGQLFFSLLEAPQLLASMTVTGTSGFAQSLSTRIAFLSFIFGEVRDVYLADINPLYKASYQNLVLSGELLDQLGQMVPFFLISGVHSPGFPWGDGESFSDVILLLGAEATGFRKFALTRRAIESLHLDVAAGTLSYRGPLVELVDRSTIRFSEIQADDLPLPRVQVQLELSFDAKRHDLAPFPFPIHGEILDRLATKLRETLQHILPSESLFGFHVLPHSVSPLAGSLSIVEGSTRSLFQLLPERSHGEADDATLHSVREPTLLYGYFCAPNPESRETRIQFHASSLRNERDHWGKDRLDAWLGAVISHFMAKQILVSEQGVVVTDLETAEAGSTATRPLRSVGAPILELCNDHFPTASFQRRIVVVEDAAGVRRLALEEAMDTLRRESIHSDRNVVVASIRNPDKGVALRTAIAVGGLFAALDDKCRAIGKPREALRVVIKPNFMFAYDRLDHTTYTDPELVHCLVNELQQAGYRRIQVVEAQSTYGEYFTGREVRSVAEYLGFATDGSLGYEVVDLTLDQQELRNLGPHLGDHPVPWTWRDADFRISFAKNKTHSYAYYTLTLKNIYGSLSLANKFKEYHVERDIYQTTIDYLKAYPVDFGIIDAHVSADGPFGIFADADPNLTETVLAGADLVALDWVGASKMGLDPRVSPYMQFAIAAFGKPRIELIGDATLYRPWLNVPRVLTLLAHLGIDANYHFGNLFYLAAAHMDPARFPLRPASTLQRLARAAMEPVRDAAFLQAGGQRRWANLALGKLFKWLGT